MFPYIPLKINAQKMREKMLWGSLVAMWQMFLFFSFVIF